MRNYMNKAEFARHCGVSPPSITRATEHKQILISSNGLIDANAPKNVAYMQHQIERKTRLARGRAETRPYAERSSEHRLAFVARSAPEPDKLPEKEPDESPEEDDDLPPLPPKRPPTKEEAAILEAGKTEIDYAIEKMRSTTAINKARLAEMVRATVRRDFVDRVISMIGTAISDHLITMGDRLSPDLAALAGSTEASVVRQIKHALDLDVSAALHEMQRVVAERYERRLEE